EAVVFPRVYERSVEGFREDAILVIEGKGDSRSERPQIVGDRAEAWTPPANGTPPPMAVVVVKAPPPPPAPVAPPRPPAANGANGANGHAKAPEAPGPAAKHVLRVVVPRNGDDNACVRVLEQLHVLVERFPGQDEMLLVLHDRSGGRVTLDGTEIG